MALIHLDFESQYLGSNQDVYIIMPDKPRKLTPQQFYDRKVKYPVLWLLHGTFGGYSDWIRKSNIELYACEKDLIVIMPGVGNSSYEAWNNFTLGYDSEKYIVDELMPLVYNWLPASDRREDNFIAGLSMGGGGALKFAMNYPDRFEACASLSCIPRKPSRAELEKLWDMNIRDILADEKLKAKYLRQYNTLKKYESVDEYLSSSSNLYGLVTKALKSGRHPRLMFACGSDDPLFKKEYSQFKEYCDRKGYDIEWHLAPGSHEWRVWDRDIQLTLKFFGLDKKDRGNAF